MSLGKVNLTACHMTCPIHKVCVPDCTSDCAPKTEAERQGRILEYTTGHPYVPPTAKKTPRRRLFSLDLPET